MLSVVEDVGAAAEPGDLSRDPDSADRNSGLLEPSGVLFAFVSQRVVLSGQDERWGKAGEVLPAEWGHVWFVASGGVGYILLPRPDHLVSGKVVVAVAEQSVGLCFRGVIGHGVYQDLAGKRGPVVVARPQGCRGSKIATRAASRDDQPFGRHPPSAGAL